MEAHEIVAPAPRNPVERDERARKTAKFLLRKTRETGQVHIAHYSGVSEATISRWFSENVEGLAKALTYMGAKIVPMDAVCVKNREELDHLLYLAKRGMESMRSADDLLFEENE